MGEGVRTCGIAREKLFVTTKLAAEAKTYAEAAAAIDGSLKTMGLDYIDMMLIHSPQPWVKVNQCEDRYVEGNREAWRALEDAYKAGKLRAIGISNFEKQDIDNLLAGCSVTPMVNQLLVHISNTPFDLIRYSESRGMLVEASSPAGHGEDAEKSGGQGHGPTGMAITVAPALHPLHPPARHAAPAQDCRSRPHAGQCEGGFCDHGQRHGSPEADRTHPRLR